MIRTHDLLNISHHPSTTRPGLPPSFVTYFPLQQECIIVCIVSLEDISINPHNVPYDQCREIRTEGVGGNKQLDYIIIPASAAIVATVIIAVIIFIACLKTSSKKRKGKVKTNLAALLLCLQITQFKAKNALFFFT